MKKQGLLVSLVGIILLAVYNAIVFVIKTGDKGPSFWISYIFTMVGFGLTALVMVLIARKNGLIQNWFLNYPIARFATIYIALQVILSVVFILVGEKLIPSISFLCQFVLLGVFAILIIVGFVSKLNVEEVTQTVQSKVLFIDMLRVEAEMLCQVCDASQTQAMATFQSLAEMVSLSDPISAPALESLENEISAKIYAARRSLSQNDVATAVTFCQEAKVLLVERNQKTKVLK